MTLSVCMIVKDEREVLARCLECVRSLADEIIVVDTGSQDGSQDIARSFTDKVYPFEWCDDFSAARNFSFEKATCELVMWLDADDVVAQEDVKKLCALKERMEEYDVAFLQYVTQDDDGRDVLRYVRERIFRRCMGFKWKGVVHEAIEPRGRILYSDARILHKKVKPAQPMRNLRIYQKIISKGGTLDSRGMFYYGRELFYNGMYAECTAVLTRFLKSDGWSENKAEACLMLYDACSALGDSEDAMRFLLKSFEEAPPKSRACCILGDSFYARGDLPSAEYWYRTAAALPQDINSGAFIDCDYSGFIPYIRLCVVYDRMGDHKKAFYYNELAGSIKPKDESYLYNKQYFMQRHRLI